MWPFNMFVTLKVFKLIGPSNDGWRHGRGTYLLSKVKRIHKTSQQTRIKRPAREPRARALPSKNTECPVQKTRRWNQSKTRNMPANKPVKRVYELFTGWFRTSVLQCMMHIQEIFFTEAHQKWTQCCCQEGCQQLEPIRIFKNKNGTWINIEWLWRGNVHNILLRWLIERTSGNQIKLFSKRRKNLENGSRLKNYANTCTRTVAQGNFFFTNWFLTDKCKVHFGGKI
jgi:hypothetical protein